MLEVEHAHQPDLRPHTRRQGGRFTQGDSLFQPMLTFLEHPLVGPESVHCSREAHERLNLACGHEPGKRRPQVGVLDLQDGEHLCGLCQMFEDVGIEAIDEREKYAACR